MLPKKIILRFVTSFESKVDNILQSKFCVCLKYWTWLYIYITLKISQSSWVCSAPIQFKYIIRHVMNERLNEVQPTAVRQPLTWTRPQSGSPILILRILHGKSSKMKLVFNLNEQKLKVVKKKIREIYYFYFNI